MKYLSEITDVNKIDHELFNGFVETILPSDEAIEEINKKIEEGRKPVKKPFPYRNIESITIDDVGNWTIKGDKL